MAAELAPATPLKRQAAEAGEADEAPSAKKSRPPTRRWPFGLQVLPPRGEAAATPLKRQAAEAEAGEAEEVPSAKESWPPARRWPFGLQVLADATRSLWSRSTGKEVAASAGAAALADDERLPGEEIAALAPAAAASTSTAALADDECLTGGEEAAVASATTAALADDECLPGGEEAAVASAATAALADVERLPGGEEAAVPSAATAAPADDECPPGCREAAVASAATEALADVERLSGGGEAAVASAAAAASADDERLPGGGEAAVASAAISAPADDERLHGDREAAVASAAAIAAEPAQLAGLSSSPPKVLLVVGECGDGKSTLINALRDPERSGEAAAGLSSRGVTKAITAYVGLPIAGQPVDLLDTPGIGDTDVTPMKVLTLIEQELITEEVNGVADAIDGVVVTTPIPDGRVKLGAQLVKLLVAHGFVGEEKWRNVILVGTKADRATDEELELFGTQRLDEEGRPLGIAGQFFEDAPLKTGTFVTTSKGDYSQLRRAIAELPAMKVAYNTPDPAKMADAFASKLGIAPEHFREELETSREQLREELNRQFEEREADFQRKLTEMQARHEEDLRSTAAESQRQSEQFQADLEARLEAKARLVDELRLAPLEERAALERKVAEAEADRTRAEEAFELDRRRYMAQLEEKEHQLKQLMHNLERREQAMMQRARNYSFGGTSVGNPHCLHLRTRNWGNAHGQGRKCVDCKKELGR